MAEKKKLFVSFSGGLSSAYMVRHILMTYDRNEWDVVVIFANTGKEREETLEFVRDCDRYFNFGTVWVEAVINPEHGRGTRARVVSFESAARNGEPFEAMIRKYGLPNIAFAHCTRELKTVAMTAYVRKTLGWKKYYTAIGIRADEVDRINPQRQKLRYLYPLISQNIRRPDVNRFWLQQPFTLNLKSYEGNCDLCFKKSNRKLLTICKENPAAAEWWQQMESKYGDFIPASRIKSYREAPQTPVRFYRKNLSIADFMEMAKQPFTPARDESRDVAAYREQLLFPMDEMDISNGCTESCEPF